MRKTRERNRRSRLLIFAAVLGLVATTGAGLAQADDNDSPRVIPPNAQIFGHTYAEWSARWWQWNLMLPADHHPLTDTADCSTAQLGPVWFLGGSSTGGTTTRHCTVPRGKFLFFPIINVECSNLEEPPFFGATAAARRRCATAIADGIANISAELDSVPIRNLGRFRTLSPNFHFAVPPNNVLGVPAAAGEAVADGIYLMLTPLDVGRHTLHFRGSFPEFGFTLDVTYDLRVKQR